MVNCGKCFTPIPDSDQFCPNCGAPRSDGAPGPRSGGVAKTVFGMPGVSPGSAPQFGGPAGGYGAPPPPAGGGYGAPPPPAGGGYGAPPPSAGGGFGAPGGYGTPPPAGGGFGDPGGGFGDPGGGFGNPGGGFGGPAPAAPGSSPGGFGGGFGAPVAPGSSPGGFGGAPAPGGFGGAPAPGGFGGAPAPGGFGGAPAPGGFGGAPAPGGFGGAPAPGGMTPAAPEGGKKKGGCGKIILIVFLVLLGLGILGGIGSAVACYVCASSAVNAVAAMLIPDLTQTITLGPDSDTETIGGREGSPYRDFNFTSSVGGTYNCSVTSTGGGDPYLVILRDGTEVAHDDDSGGGLNARAALTAEAGVEYTIRAANLGALEADTTFTVGCLTDIGSIPGMPSIPGLTPPTPGATPEVPGTTPPVPGATPEVPGATPPVAGGGATGCAGLEACCGSAGSTPQGQASCAQLPMLRGLPGGAGESACTTTLNGLRAALQGSGQAVPAACQ
jgi:hypothetical protein